MAAICKPLADAGCTLIGHGKNWQWTSSGLCRSPQKRTPGYWCSQNTLPGEQTP